MPLTPGPCALQSIVAYRVLFLRRLPLTFLPLRKVTAMLIGISSIALIFGLLLATTVVDGISLFTHKNPAFPDPIDDPFYKPPLNLNTYQPGFIIRSRKVNTTISSSKTAGSYQILYRTTDTQNKAEATVATVWEPIHPRSPAQILSYHSYMDSDSFDCAPSWGWLNNSASKGWAPLITDAPIFVDWALKHGIYVLDPDDEGPKAAFIAGFQQGQVSLHLGNLLRIWTRADDYLLTGCLGRHESH